MVQKVLSAQVLQLVSQASQVRPVVSVPLSTDPLGQVPTQFALERYWELSQMVHVASSEQVLQLVSHGSQFDPK